MLKVGYVTYKLKLLASLDSRMVGKRDLVHVGLLLEAEDGSWSRELHYRGDAPIVECRHEGYPSRLLATYYAPSASTRHAELSPEERTEDVTEYEKLREELEQKWKRSCYRLGQHDCWAFVKEALIGLGVDMHKIKGPLHERRPISLTVVSLGQTLRKKKHVALAVNAMALFSSSKSPDRPCTRPPIELGPVTNSPYMSPLIEPGPVTNSPYMSPLIEPVPVPVTNRRLTKKSNAQKESRSDVRVAWRLKGIGKNKFKVTTDSAPHKCCTIM